MSEFINNREKRIEKLLEFFEGFMNDYDGLSLYKDYKPYIEHITPMDMVIIVDKIIEKGYDMVVLKKVIDKIMNIVYHPLLDYEWTQPPAPHPLTDLIEENRALEKILNELKLTIRNQNIKSLREYLEKLKEFEVHYIKKENILFPALEKKWDSYKCLQLHWSIHDDIRAKLKQTIAYAEKVQAFDHTLNKLVGELFFLMFGMVIKDNIVLFPAAYLTLNERDWQLIDEENRETGFAFYTPPKQKFQPSKEFLEEEKKNDISKTVTEKIITDETGSLTETETFAILNTIPADITFIDAKDEVKFFSKPEERFFHRSVSIIGRKVQNCHPPESVHIVEKILDSFKSGKKNKARFWIQMKGKFILIEYYAVRSKTGKYLGTLEVSQDISDIRKLEGERRLLEWE